MIVVLIVGRYVMIVVLYHSLLAWMNFLPTLRKSFSWWVVSCTILKNVFSIMISVVSRNSSFSSRYSWFE